MKKIFTLILIAITLFTTACKKDKTEKDENASITVVGEWKLTAYKELYYIDDKLEKTDNEAEDGVEILQLKADGTGKFGTSTEVYAEFNYIATETVLTFNNYVAYWDGKPMPATEDLSLKILNLNATQLEVEERTSSIQNGITYTHVTRATYTKIPG